MKIKKIIILGLMIITIITVPLTTAENNYENSGPILEVGLSTYLGTNGPKIFVRNIGDEIAHNVKLVNLSVVGNVVYNNRVTYWEKDVSPDSTISDYPNSLFFGLGVFTATITVSCDEGVTTTGSGNGIVFGLILFVP